MFFLRDLIVPALIFLIPAAPGAADATPLACGGAAKQSGLLVCTGPADTLIDIQTPDGTTKRTVSTNEHGDVLIGLTQDEASELILVPQSRGAEAISVTIAPRQDDYRVIKGLDCDKVDARTEAQKAHAADSWVKKQDAFGRFNTGPGAAQGFVQPATGR